MIAAPMPTELERRVAAAQILLDDWKGRPFDWKTNSHCARLISQHLRRMGYTPPLAKAGPFRSALGASRAMARLKVASMAQVIDGLGLARIAPAAALPGDIIEIPGEAPFGALTVAVGNGRVLGFHEDAEGVTVMQPLQFVAAWRVPPAS